MGKGPEARGSAECCVGVGGLTEEQLGHRSLERRGFGGDGEAAVSWCRTQAAICSCLNLVLGKWAALEDFSRRSDMTRFEYCKIVNVENIFMG